MFDVYICYGDDGVLCGLLLEGKVMNLILDVGFLVVLIVVV